MHIVTHTSLITFNWLYIQVLNILTVVAEVVLNQNPYCEAGTNSYH